MVDGDRGEKAEIRNCSHLLFVIHHSSFVISPNSASPFPHAASGAYYFSSLKINQNASMSPRR
jgi:hypothetical protein